MTPDDEEQWWRGLALWYNDLAYPEAMEVWKNIVLPFASSARDFTTDDHFLDAEGHFSPWSDQKEPSMVRSLALFLSGCYLDAGEQGMARQMLVDHCLARSVASQGEHAVKELIDAFEEDPKYRGKSYLIARQVMSWAIEQNFIPTTRSCFQRPSFYFDIGTQAAVLRKAEHPSWCRVLEENYPTIREELETLVRKRALWPHVGDANHRNGSGSHDDSVVSFGGEWREIVLFGSGARPDLAPRTAAIVQQVVPCAVDCANDGLGEVIFSLLTPRTRISPHCGTTNLRLTAHLGLSIPKECWIRVANKKLLWEEGKVIVFDDSFEHEVINDSGSYRAVLLLRFWHPNVESSGTSRDELVRQTIARKVDDQRRRYNPPLPTTDRPCLQGMESTSCPSCGRRGYESVRVDVGARALRCVCGQMIV